MILRSISIEGWRCLAKRLDLTGFSERIQLIAAPNGAGKSTVFEALRTGLFTRHRAQGQAVKELRPWGTDLSPSVTIEFGHGGGEYRLSKRWLSRPFARLEQRLDGDFSPLAGDEAAEKRVLDMFGASAPRAGLARPEHWGLFQVLWAPQGDLVLGGLEGNLVARLRADLTGRMEPTEISEVERRVEEAFSAYFAPGGGLRRGKGAPDLVRDRERVEDLTRSRAELLETLEEIESLTRSVEDARAVREGARAEENGVERELTEVRLAARAYAALVGERDRGSAEIGAVRSEHARIVERIAGIEAARAERRELEEKLAGIEADHEAARVELAERFKNLERARQAHRLLEARASAERAGAKLAELSRMREEIRKKRAECADLAAPDPEDLREIRELLRERAEARAEVRASSIRLRIELLRDARVDVARGEDPGGQEGAAGETITIRGAPDAEAVIGDVARISARGAGDEAGERLSALEDRLRERTAPYGTSDIAALEAAADQARELERGVRTLTDRVAALLDGGDADGVGADLERSRREVEEILAARPEWAHEPPDPPKLEVEEDGLARARLHEAELRERRTGMEQGLRRVRERLDGLLSDGLSDEERRERREEIALRHDAARVKLAAAERELAAQPDDPREREARLEAMRAEHRERADRASGRENLEVGRLRTLTEAGDWVKLARIEEELESLRRRVEREEAHAEAVKLLRDTLVDCRADAIEAVAGPVAETATYYFQRIAGPRLGEVGLNASLTLEDVRPERAEEAVSEATVSGGEREQLHLAVRLALADVLARNERQLLVLDDALTATDTGRMARVLGVLEEAANRLQIVILTCHPERYVGLAGAECFDL